MPLFRESRTPTDDEIRLITKMRHQIDKERQAKSSLLKILQMRSPIREGLFHLAKIQVDQDQFIHAQIYMPTETRTECQLDNIKPAFEDEELLIFVTDHDE